MNPERGDLIAVLGETTGHRALRAIHARMMSDPVGQMILQNKPVISIHSFSSFPFPPLLLSPSSPLHISLPLNTMY